MFAAWDICQMRRNFRKITKIESEHILFVVIETIHCQFFSTLLFVEQVRRSIPVFPKLVFISKEDCSEELEILITLSAKGLPIGMHFTFAC